MYAQALNAVLERLAATARDAGRPVPRLLAVSKTQPATAVAEMAAALRSAAAHELNVTGVAHAPAFGENYVQAALDKQAALTSETPVWPMIAHRQSNQAREAAAATARGQHLDRDQPLAALAPHPTHKLPP